MESEPLTDGYSFIKGCFSLWGVYGCSVSLVGSGAYLGARPDGLLRRYEVKGRDSFSVPIAVAAGKVTR